jgi:hypothetical protein
MISCTRARGCRALRANRRRRGGSSPSTK